MKDRRASASVFVLFGAAAVFGALGSSAFSLASLPAPGFDLGARGFPPSLDVGHAAAVVDEAEGKAWLVDDHAVCALDLARGTTTGCRAFAETRAPPHHLAVGRRLLVTHDVPGAPADAIAFDFLVMDEGGTVTLSGRGRDTFPKEWSHGATMLNLAWDAEAEEALVTFEWRRDDQRRVVRLPIDLGRGIGEPSVRVLSAELPPLRAAFGGESPKWLFTDRSMRTGDGAAPLQIAPGKCIGVASVGCVALAGEARAVETAIFALITADGEVHDPPAPAPGASAGGRFVRQRLAEAVAKSLADARLLTTTDLRLEMPFARTRASFEVRQGGGERVLFGRVTDGHWARVARGASPIASWTVLAHAGGALALDADTRRGVVLGPNLAPVDPLPRGLATIGDLAHERWRAADLDVKLFVLFACLFPPLFALALVAEVRRRRAPTDASSLRALAALAGWALATAVFLWLRRGELFPP